MQLSKSNVQRVIGACIALPAALAATSPAHAGDITLNVFASSAPNASGSPSWGAYASNAMYSIENALGTTGDRTTNPAAYEVAGPIVDAGDFIVSSFKSWRGGLNPSGAFANELGNRMHFGLHAMGNGTAQFRLADLTFSLTSSDVQAGYPNGGLGFVGNFIGYSYTGTTRVGIDWGADRVRGTTDDIRYTSGNGTTLVDELVYVGVGNAFWPSPTGTQTNQDAMDSALAYVDAWSPFVITGQYWIQGNTGSAAVSTIPAPGAPVLLGMCGLLTLRRRR